MARLHTARARFPLPLHTHELTFTLTLTRRTCARALSPPSPAVVLTGGGSNLSGLSKRLYWEALTLIPSAFKPRILTASALERKFSSWIGASILSALGTFQQMWVSKADYDEMGPSVVLDKCQ